MYFCQSAMEAATVRALGCAQGLLGGLLVDGAPAPRLAPGYPVGAVYVDNTLLLGYSKEDCAAALGRLCATLEEAGLEYREL